MPAESHVESIYENASLANLPPNKVRLCTILIDARPLDFWWLSPRLPIPVQSRHVPLVSSNEAFAVNIECAARYRATRPACSSSINILRHLVSYAATMPLGILQDRHLEHVPGTATLNDLDPIAALQEQADGRELKRSRNGTILVPQPSNDPNGMAFRLYSSGSRTLATRNNTN
jgi:hypothetical protein